MTVYEPGPVPIHIRRPKSEFLIDGKLLKTQLKICSTLIYESSINY